MSRCHESDLKVKNKDLIQNKTKKTGKTESLYVGKDKGSFHICYKYVAITQYVGRETITVNIFLQVCVFTILKERRRRTLLAINDASKEK